MLFLQILQLMQLTTVSLWTDLRTELLWHLFIRKSEFCILWVPTVGYEKGRWWGLHGEKPFNHPSSFDLEIKELKWDVK